MSERALWRMVAGQKKGPYPPARLRPLVKDGRIGSLDRFSYDGISWAPFGDFPELLQEPPPPVEEVYTVNLDDEGEPVATRGPADSPERDDGDGGLLVAVCIIAGVGACFVLLVVVFVLGSLL